MIYTRTLLTEKKKLKMSNPYRESTFKRLFIVISFFAVAFVLSVAFNSCNTTKQSNRHFYKALNKSHTATANNCSIAFPPVEATKDSFIYIQGEDVVTHDTVQGNEYLVLGDTVVKYKYITKTVKITDTLRLTNKTTIVDKAKVVELQEKNTELTINNAKQKKALSICLWSITILGAYTLLRWILRIWSIKLP